MKEKKLDYKELEFITLKSFPKITPEITKEKTPESNTQSTSKTPSPYDNPKLLAALLSLQEKPKPTQAKPVPTKPENNSGFKLQKSPEVNPQTHSQSNSTLTKRPPGITHPIYKGKIIHEKF